MTHHKSAADRRKEILEAARRRFVSEGYTRSRLDDIAEDAGLSKGGVYFHFKSKRALLDALIEEGFQRSMRAISLMRSMQGSVTDRLIIFAKAGLRAYAAKPDIARFQVVMAEMALGHVEIRDRLHEIHATFVRELAELLGEGVAKGELRADLDADAGARLLVTLMDGLRGSVATDLNRGAELEEIIERSVHLVAEGLLYRG